MKLYIKQKVFSWNDKFNVQDEFGEERYFAQSEFLTLAKKLHVTDMSGREVAFLQQKLWTFLPKYYVNLPGRNTVEIVKDFSFLRPHYHIEGLDWEIVGKFWEHDYQILSGGRPVVSIHKQWMTWGDCYELDIWDSADEVLALCVVLAIDCITASQEAASSAATSS